MSKNNLLNTHVIQAKTTTNYKTIIAAEKSEPDLECTCSRILVAALSSTVIISVMISITLFIIGFLCGNYYNKNIQSSKKEHITTDQPHQLQAPEYEDIDTQQLARAAKHHEYPFELKENVAYVPSKINDN